MPARRTPTHLFRSALGLTGVVLTWSLVTGAPVVPDGFVDEPIATGLHYSACMAFLPDGRVIATEHGREQVVLIKPPGFEVMGRIDSVRRGSEQGLFGVAVDPRWPDFPYLYLHYAYNGAPRIHLSRFTISGDLDGTQNGSLTLDSLSEYRVLIDLPDSTAFHNGGQVHFGPDSMLYASVGDDLGSCGAQSKQILRGKILRLEVRNLPPGPGGPPPYADITPPDNPFVGHADPRAHLVLHYGLRNPYSFSIDPATGNIVIADVGGDISEEVNLATNAGLNFGWPIYEGFTPHFQCVTTDTMGMSPEFPIYTYSRPDPLTPVAVISGGVYRQVPGGIYNFPPEYDGDIFFNDIGIEFLRRLTFNGTNWQIADSVAGQPAGEDWGQGFGVVTSFEVGPDGALWYTKYTEHSSSLTGEIRAIRWVGGPVAVEPPGASPVLTLAPPAPSPARSDVRLAWTLARESRVTLEAWDVRGARVRTIVDREPLAAGAHTLIWDLRTDAGRPLKAGLYWLRLSDGSGAQAVRRLAIIR